VFRDDDADLAGVELHEGPDRERADAKRGSGANFE
jgi:hypothetical protein